MAKKEKAAQKGDRGTYANAEGEFEVTAVYELDGKLDLQGTGPNKGNKGDGTPTTNPNPEFHERVDASLFTVITPASTGD